MNIATPHLPRRAPLGVRRRSTAGSRRPISTRRISATRIVPTGRFRRDDRHDSERNTGLTELALRQVGGVHSLHH